LSESSNDQMKVGDSRRAWDDWRRPLARADPLPLRRFHLPGAFPKATKGDKTVEASERGGGFVRVDHEGPVAVVSIQNPPVNVLSRAVLKDLGKALVTLAGESEVRCLLLRGEGDKAFSAGADIREMAGMGPEEAWRHSRRGQAVTNLLEYHPLPAVAAVQGYCLGGGCELILACDFVIASQTAVFGQPEINIGIFPGWGGSVRLPRLIGATRARYWIYTGAQIPAEEARRDGLVLEVVPPERLFSEALSLAQRLAQKPALALTAAKALLLGSIDPHREGRLESERNAWGSLFGTPDQREGMAAFREKRSPQFVPREPVLPRPLDWVAERQNRFHEAARLLDLGDVPPVSPGAGGKT
jgi:enoyl-CoA hydratase